MMELLRNKTTDLPWGRILPIILLWGLAPAPIYIWIALVLMMKIG